jgi:hypothetical protein
MASVTAGVASVVLLFGVPWVTRGVLLSGYPFFPVSILGFPVSWRAPVEHAQAEYAFIGFTEREFSWKFGKWLEQIFVYDIYSAFVPAVLVLLVVFSLILFRSRRMLKGDPWRDTYWTGLPSLIAIVGWLLSAPSTRYGLALFWTLAAVALSEFVLVLWKRGGSRSLSRSLTAIAVLAFFPSVMIPVVGAVTDGEAVGPAILDRNLVVPEYPSWVGSVPKVPETLTFTTRYGVQLNVPKRPDDRSFLAKCWNAPLPCTSSPAANLRLIEAGKLESGFMVEGGWEMETWPNYWQDTFLSEWRARTGTGSEARSR